jgi:serum/glucocorticoid-regulated kinase 2
VLYEMLVGIPPYYNDNIKILYQNIEKGKLKIPKYLSNDAKKCLQRMLNRNPAKRPKMAQLMKDPFFADIDWKKLEARELAPPTILCRNVEHSTAKKSNEEDDMAMLFEQPEESKEGPTDEQSGSSGAKTSLLYDEDYNEDNRTYNRVKNYSFARV